MPFHAASKFLLVLFFASESTLDPRRLYSSVDITQLTFLAWGWPVRWFCCIENHFFQYFRVKVYKSLLHLKIWTAIQFEETRLKLGEQSIEDYPVLTIEWILENLSQSTYLLACLLLTLLSRVTEFPIHCIRFSFVSVLEFPSFRVSALQASFSDSCSSRLAAWKNAFLLTSDSGNRIISQKQIANRFKYIKTPKNKHQRTSKKQNRRVNIMKSTHNLQRLRGGYSMIFCRWTA